MFDLGFWEIVLVLVVALLVVGPERLPGLARQVGLWVGKAKRFVSSVRSDIERELEAEELKRILNKQQDQIRELKGMISETQTEVHSELTETEHLVSAIEEQLESKQPDPDPQSPPKDARATAVSLQDDPQESPRN
jgi:sec-independent protein translocase protein TatB